MAIQIATVLLLAVASSAAESKTDPVEAWKAFKAAFGKTFANGDDEQAHFVVFQQNMDRAKRFTQEDGSATYSYMTPFADVTPEEFARTHYGFLSGTVEDRVDDEPNATLPSSFDWRDKGAVNPIKNQAQCGSCWAFSTVANIEGVNFVKTGHLLSLSEQELIDCDKSDNGCGGGLPSNADKYLIQKHLGLEGETVYPYTAKNGKKCKAESSQEKVFITGWKPISQNENVIASALMQYAPLSIGINAGPMQLYHGGVSNPSNCDPAALDHGVAIVGFGVDGSKKYWSIRNSWGSTWGEKGYYRIVRGVGKCGMNRMVTTATMGSELITV